MKMILMAKKARCPTSKERLQHQLFLEDLQGLALEFLNEDGAKLIIESAHESATYLVMLANRNEEDCPGLRQYLEMHILLAIITDGTNYANEQIRQRIADGKKDRSLS